MCWLRWPNHIFQEKWHKARSYGTKNCLSKPKLSSVSKANLIFAEQTKMSNTGLAPVRVFREARCIHHHLFPISARLSASVVPFSEQKVFSLSWERVGEKRWFTETGKKGCDLHFPYCEVQTCLIIGRFETGNQGGSTLCFRTITGLFRQM